MEIEYANNRLRDICDSTAEAKRALGAKRAEKLRNRLDDIDAAACLSDLGALRHLECHELKGDRKGQLSLVVVKPFALVFVPANSPVPFKPDGGLDWSKVTKVKLIEITNYH